MMGFENFNYSQAIILTIALWASFKAGKFYNAKHVIDGIGIFFQNKKKNVTADDMISFLFPRYFK